MKQKLSALFKTILLHEIDIDFKSLTYFFCVPFFCSVVRLFHGIHSIPLLTLAEILLTNYVICYIQTYLLRNFDESERLGASEIIGTAVCTALYTAVGLLLAWFDRSLLLTLLFAAYMVLCYISVILCHIIRRRLDTRQLNRLLESYKQNNLSSERNEDIDSTSD